MACDRVRSCDQRVVTHVIVSDVCGLVTVGLVRSCDRMHLVDVIPPDGGLKTNTLLQVVLCVLVHKDRPEAIQ